MTARTWPSGGMPAKEGARAAGVPGAGVGAVPAVGDAVTGVTAVAASANTEGAVSAADAASAPGAGSAPVSKVPSITSAGLGFLARDGRGVLAAAFGAVDSGACAVSSISLDCTGGVAAVSTTAARLADFFAAGGAVLVASLAALADFEAFAGFADSDLDMASSCVR